MKKSLFLLFFTLCSFTLKGQTWPNHSERDVNGNMVWYILNSNHTATITWREPGNFACYSGYVVIPDSIYTDSVTYVVRDTYWSAFRLSSNLKNVVLPSTLQTIGEESFYNCSKLDSLRIPAKCNKIVQGAFNGCSSLNVVYCEAVTPPSLGSNAFKNIPSSATLYVPLESVDAYRAISGYASSFAEIKGFSDVTEISDTAAVLNWLPNSAVTQYDIKVYTSDTLFAHYVVDGNGQIIPSQSFAPSIYRQKLDTTVSSTDYFVISLDGLSAGTSYSFVITGINAMNEIIYLEEGTFRTKWHEGFIDAIADDPRIQTLKIIKDGQIYILRNGRIYNLNGTEMK